MLESYVEVSCKIHMECRPEFSRCFHDINVSGDRNIYTLVGYIQPTVVQDGPWAETGGVAEYTPNGHYKATMTGNNGYPRKFLHRPLDNLLCMNIAQLD